MKTEDLLQKYVTSGLSRDERFEIEKRALEDDFLADAWEGLQLHQGTDLHQKWNAIQSEWNHKTHASQKVATKVVTMKPWMQYAAAAAVLLLGAALFFMRSDDSISKVDSAVALDPIEVVDDQEVVTASESNESIAIISDLEEREEVETEKRIQAKAEKILPLSKTTQREPKAEVTSKEVQSLALPQKSSDIAFDGETQTEFATNESSNTLVRTTTPIPNPAPSAEGQAAIPIEKKVEDFGSVKIKNTAQAPIIAEIESPDRSREKSGSLFNSKKTNDPEAIELSDNQEGTQLKGVLEDLSSSLKSNSLIRTVQSTDQTQESLQKARDLFLKDKDNQGARDEARRVLVLDSKLAEGFELIGDIYGAASYTCNTDKWNQSLAVLAAFDQYSKAISKSNNASHLSKLENKMIALRDRFPTKDDGFMRGFKPGDTAQVGCWIGETVKIRYK